MSKGREITPYPEVDPSFPEVDQALPADLPPWRRPAILESDHCGSFASPRPLPREADAPVRSSHSSEHCPASSEWPVRQGALFWKAVPDPRRSGVVGKLTVAGHAFRIYVAAAYDTPEASRDGSGSREAGAEIAVACSC